jgi:hypothetical protein
MQSVAFLGHGPGESMPDRKAATPFAVHTHRIDADLDARPYVVPGESGGHTGVHWTAVRDADGYGLLVQYSCCDAPVVEVMGVDAARQGKKATRPSGMRGAQVSVSRVSVEQRRRAEHAHELSTDVQASAVHMHVDTAHQGVGAQVEHSITGGDDIWGTYPQFLVDPSGPWNFALRLTPVRPDSCSVPWSL